MPDRGGAGLARGAGRPGGRGPGEGGSRQAALAVDLAGRLGTALAGEGMENLLAVVVVHHGEIVYERYPSGADQKLGWIRRDVVFGPEKNHVRSITKSVVGLLHGIALAEGKVPGPDEPLLQSFPEYADLAAEPQRARITVGNPLTMTLGTAWREDGPSPTSE